MTAGTAMAGEAGRYQVFFELGSDRLDEDALATVTAAANEFRRTGTANVRLSGHTDTTGSTSFNEQLAQRRADAVEQELVRLGVPQSAIAEMDEGERDLLVPTGDGVAEPQNRRVEIVLDTPPPPAPVAAAPAMPAVVSEPANAVADVVDRGRFSVGAYYGLNLLDEGNDDNRDDGTSNLAGLNLSFDYLLTDWLNLSLEQAGFYNFGTDDDGFGGRSAAGLDFVFPVSDEGFSSFSSFLPYVGANIGYIYGSGIDDDFFAGPEIGLNFGPFNAKIAYDIPWDRGDLGEGIISTTVGLGLTF
ncbi:MAG TPA: OmpA family protein [Geminicoccus sp.]|jgi:hypothetical protein|uniref:OmpA family protein n=1 Tax=Geminicoccus sp. TaxID=2024832 RepID=UPI002E30EE6F|nr:OmpA family protein [Geminicoccus sp.]HEX2527991.1 OmpA family protein [Geminicoccus sp.]